MNLNSKYIDFILEKLNSKYWNIFSLFLSNLTIPIIGTPIKFKGPYGFYLQEFKNIKDIPSEKLSEFMKFRYPKNMKNRESEIAYNKEYLSYASIFVVFDSKNNHKIIGCVIFLPKIKGKKLPVENGNIVSNDIKEKFDTFRNSGTYKVAEIYHLKRCPSIERQKISSLVNMLFKAVWNKVIQTDTKFTYLTYKFDLIESRNMYMKKLPFSDINIKISYDSIIQWNVLRDDCVFHDKKLATLSRSQFNLQTYFRLNAKKKTLC